MDEYDELQAERDELEARIKHTKARIAEIDDLMYAIEQRELRKEYEEGLI